jgi:hypothetical protein
MSFSITRKPVGGRSSDNFEQVHFPLPLEAAHTSRPFSPTFDTGYNPQDCALNFHLNSMSGKPMETNTSSGSEKVRRPSGAHDPSRNSGSVRDSKQSRDVELSSTDREAGGSIQERGNAEGDDGDPYNYITGWRKNIITLASVTPHPRQLSW